MEARELNPYRNVLGGPESSLLPTLSPVCSLLVLAPDLYEELGADFSYEQAAPRSAFRVTNSRAP